MKIKLKIICVTIVIIICLFFIICLGSSAASNNEDLVYGRYILIDKVGNRTGFSRLAYDKDTYVMYVFNDDNAMLPYYIVKDKEAIVGIYNVNWFGVDNYE